MSTRSYIGTYTQGYIYFVYCHYDGYPEYNGLKLLQSYSSTEKVLQIIETGNLRKINHDNTLDPYTGDEEKYMVYKLKNYDLENPFEPGNEKITDCFREEAEEYVYLWDTVQNCWYVSDHSKPFEKLTYSMCM